MSFDRIKAISFSSFIALCLYILVFGNNESYVRHGHEVPPYLGKIMAVCCLFVFGYPKVRKWLKSKSDPPPPPNKP